MTKTLIPSGSGCMERTSEHAENGEEAATVCQLYTVPAIMPLLGFVIRSPKKYEPVQMMIYTYICICRLASFSSSRPLVYAIGYLVARGLSFPETGCCVKSMRAIM